MPGRKAPVTFDRVFWEVVVIVNIVALVILGICVFGAVRYVIRRHQVSVKTGNPGCCGCPACGCDDDRYDSGNKAN